MLSIFSYIWTKCFFYKYRIQLIWLLHSPLRLIIEWGDPNCFSLVRRCHYLSIKIINLVIMLVIKTQADGYSELSLLQPEDSGKVRNEQMWRHYINHSCCGVFIYFGHALHFSNNVNIKWLLLDLLSFSALSFSRSEIKQIHNFLEYQLFVKRIIYKANNIAKVMIKKKSFIWMCV